MGDKVCVWGMLGNVPPPTLLEETTNYKGSEVEACLECFSKSENGSVTRLLLWLRWEATEEFRTQKYDVIWIIFNKIILVAVMMRIDYRE